MAYKIGDVLPIRPPRTVPLFRFTLGNIFIKSEDLVRICLIDRFNGMEYCDCPADVATAPSDIVVDAGNTPNWVLQREPLLKAFARYDEIKRTLSEPEGVHVKDPKRYGVAMLLLQLDAKFILLLKCLIGVYNFFTVPGAPDVGARYSTLLTDDTRNDLSLMVRLLDALLSSDEARSDEARVALQSIDDTMHLVFDVLASAAGEEVKRCGLAGVRTAYRSLHEPHKPNEFSASTRLMAAFGKLADFFADRENRWVRDRPPAPEVASAKLKPDPPKNGERTIPLKIVASAFDVSVNTICNWNRGKARPFDYQGPYPDTPDGVQRMLADAVCHLSGLYNKLMVLSNEEATKIVGEHNIPHYAQFRYDAQFAMGTGKRVMTPVSPESAE